MRETSIQNDLVTVRAKALDLSTGAGTGLRSAEPLTRSHDRLVVLFIDGSKTLCPAVGTALGTALSAWREDVDIVPISEAREATSRFLGATVCILAAGTLAPSDARVATDLAHLASTLPGTPIVILADTARPSDIVAALRQGVRGYLQSSLELPTLVQAVRVVNRGGIFVQAEPLPEAATPSADPGRPAPSWWVGRPTCGLKSLTPREYEVLLRLRRGKPNKIIAHELVMSEFTVKAHVQSIMRKVGVTNRTQLSFLSHSLDCDDVPKMNRPHAEVPPVDEGPAAPAA